MVPCGNLFAFAFLFFFCFFFFPTSPRPSNPATLMKLQRVAFEFFTEAEDAAAVLLLFLLFFFFFLFFFVFFFFLLSLSLIFTTFAGGYSEAFFLLETRCVSWAVPRTQHSGQPWVSPSLWSGHHSRCAVSRRKEGVQHRSQAAEHCREAGRGAGTV
jgi:hypothetical protein